MDNTKKINNLYYKDFKHLANHVPTHKELDYIFNECTDPLKIMNITYPLDNLFNENQALVKCKCPVCSNNIEFRSTFTDNFHE
jgi:hypothetical protein